jgi:hypothetical protein
MVTYLKALVITLILLPISATNATEFGTTIPMLERGSATYYVPVTFEGAADNDLTDLMVDTGSGYVTINETTLSRLKEQGNAHYVKELTGIMANGSEVVVTVYRITGLNIGCCCTIRDVEAAVFPGTERQILGLSALKKVAPFALSIDPPHLILSHCEVNSSEYATKANYDASGGLPPIVSSD